MSVLLIRCVQDHVSYFSSKIYSLTCQSLLDGPAANCILLLQTGGRVSDGEKMFYLCAQNTHYAFYLIFIF